VSGIALSLEESHLLCGISDLPLLRFGSAWCVLADAIIWCLGRIDAVKKKEALMSEEEKRLNKALLDKVEEYKRLNAIP
jgi:hypothetical protein